MKRIKGPKDEGKSGGATLRNQLGQKKGLQHQLLKNVVQYGTLKKKPLNAAGLYSSTL